MLIYIIPFVLLLVVALILKKKEANQQNSEKKKPQAIKGNKKTQPVKGKGSVTSNTAQTSVTTEPTPESVQTNLEFRKRIETLMREKKFSTAEALINQELNRDKSQHELYLLLADIHLTQDDHFGLVQLLSHLRALNLFDLVRQIEVTLQQSKKTSVQHTSVQLNNLAPNPEPLIAAQTEIEATSVEVKTTSSTAPVQVIEVENTAHSTRSEPDINTPNFNFEDFDQIKSAPQANNHTQNLDFRLELEPHSVETKGASINVTKTDIGNGLEFKFKQVHPHLNIEASSVETKHATVSALANTAPLMEFNLEPNTTEVHLEQQPAQDSAAPHLAFDFDFNAPATAEKPLVNTETTVPSTPVEISNSSFEFTPIDHTTADTMVEAKSEVVQSPTVTHTAFLFDEKTVTQVPQTSTSIAVTDPILQQFAELGQMKETQLDLDLAQQYIKLGAYEAARDLLITNMQKFDLSEAEKAKKLLNQIAS